MDSFLRLYKQYYAINAWSVFKPVYLAFSVRLWASLLLLLMCAGLVVYFRTGPWVMVPFALISLAWIDQHFKAVERHYSRHYSAYADRLRFYGKDYQYLRYCIFQERLADGPFVGDIDDAIAHVDIELETEVSTVVSSHPFIAGGLALLFGVVGGSVGAWKAETTVLTVVWLFVIVVVAYMSKRLVVPPCQILIDSQAGPLTSSV